jgi:hypothetical protein
LWGTRQEHKQSGHSAPANAHSRPDASGAAGERRRIAAAARHWRRRWRRTRGWWLAPAAGSSRSGTTATAPRCVPFPPLFRALLALTPLCPVALRFARGTPSICRAAVRRRADCVGSASDWRPVPSLCRIPRFCCVGVGGFRCGCGGFSVPRAGRVASRLVSLFPSPPARDGGVEKCRGDCFEMDCSNRLGLSSELFRNSSNPPVC